MRAIFSFLSLLLVALAIGWLAKKQLNTVVPSTDSNVSQPIQLQDAQKHVRDALKAAQEQREKNMQQSEQQ